MAEADKEEDSSSESIDMLAQMAEADKEEEMANDK